MDAARIGKGGSSRSVLNMLTYAQSVLCYVSEEVYPCCP